MPERISEQYQLIILNSLGSHVGDRLPPTAEPLYHEAAEFSSHSLFNDFLVEHSPADIVEQPHAGSDFLRRASRRARSLGEFAAAEKFIVRGVALARKVPAYARSSYMHDAGWEQSMLLAQTGRTLIAEKTLLGAQKVLEQKDANTHQAERQLTSRERLLLQEKRYAGYVTLAAFQARQGKFSMSIRSGRRAMNIAARGGAVADSQRRFGAIVLPALEQFEAGNGNGKHGLTPEQEEAYWPSLHVMSPGFHFTHEIPLTGEEREKYLPVVEPANLPTAQEVSEAYSHDRTFELVDRYYRSGTPDERYEILTREYIYKLAEIVKHRVAAQLEPGEILKVLEVGAGDARLSGFLGQALREIGQAVAITAADLRTDRTQQVFPVEKLDYEEALKEIDPHVVVSSWMPWKADWTPAFRARPNVRGYVLLGDSARCGTAQSWRAPDSEFMTEDLSAVNELRTIEHPYAPYVTHGTTRGFWRNEDQS